MTSQSHSACTVGYNVQSAVDAEHHHIVAHDVTNIGIDKGHLGSMAEQARDPLEAETIEASADSGYFKSEEIAACEDAGIVTYVPRPADLERPSRRPIRSPGLRLRR
jgi:transposase